MPSNAKPQDLVSLLEENFKAGRPLLEDATLFRGTRLPDQTLSSFSPDTMHTSILPQVAASYTHNWDEKLAFIGTYKLDRENTRFYPDYGLEKAQQGDAVKSLSVKEAEALLAPLVARYAAATGRERSQAETALENTIKTHMYESNTPTRTLEGQPNRPTDLYGYPGSPGSAVRQYVVHQLQPMTPALERTVKEVMHAEFRSPATDKLHSLAGNAGRAQGAIQVLEQAGAAEFRKATASLDQKPLNEFLNALSSHGSTPQEEKLARFGTSLVASLTRESASERETGARLIAAVEQLTGQNASFKDIVSVASASNSASQGMAHGANPSQDIRMGRSMEASASPDNASRSSSDAAPSTGVSTPTRASSPVELSR